MSSLQRPEGNERSRPRGGGSCNTRQRATWALPSTRHDDYEKEGDPNHNHNRAGAAPASSSSPHDASLTMSSSNSLTENEKLHLSASYSHNPYTSPTTKFSPATVATTQPHPEPVGGGVTVVLSYAPRHLRHRNPIFQEPAPPPPPPVASIDHPPPFRLDALPSPAVAPPAPQRPMCCYFKQKGYCKMGATCWYSHEGDLYTPCHYGASCKAGHATLVLMREKSDAQNQQQH